MAVAVNGALEFSPYRPAAYHVRDEFSRAAVASLAQAFEIPIKIAPLPGFDEARAALEHSMR